MSTKVNRIYCISCGLSLKRCMCPYPKQSIRIELVKENEDDAGKEVIQRQV